MDRAKRAKQFMPFAALSGFDKAIEMANVEKYNKRERVVLSEEDVFEINEELKDAKKGDVIEVSCYIDREYKSIIGRLEEINSNFGYIIVDADDIYEMGGEGLVKEGHNVFLKERAKELKISYENIRDIKVCN